MNRGVEIRDLRKEFALVRWQGLRRRSSQVTAVDGITLDVPAGQSVAFIGPNGAGAFALHSYALRRLFVNGG